MGEILAVNPAMTTLLRVALIAMTLCAMPCVAQTGTVTFYTPGTSAKNVAAGILPRSEQPFTGWLFDGRQRLVHVRPNRFITFHLASGEHSITVPYHSKQPGKEPLVIHVESGGKSCYRLSAKMTNLELIPWSWLNSQIEEVPCEQAQREAAHMKAIELKRVDPSVRAELDSATTFAAGSPSQQ